MVVIDRDLFDKPSDQPFIIFRYGIDRITKNHYKADVKKDSITLAPAGEAEQLKPVESEKAQ